MPLTLVVTEGITSITGDTDTLMMVTGGTEHPLCPLRGGEWQLMVITAPSALWAWMVVFSKSVVLTLRR